PERTTRRGTTDVPVARQASSSMTQTFDGWPRRRPQVPHPNSRQGARAGRGAPRAAVGERVPGRRLWVSPRRDARPCGGARELPAPGGPDRTAVEGDRRTAAVPGGAE